jgi:uncharacterized membrane protein
MTSETTPDQPGDTPEGDDAQQHPTTVTEGVVVEPATTEGGLNVDVAAVTDGIFTLMVADFDDTDAAWAAYQLLEEAEDGRTVKIEGIIVVRKDPDGIIEIQKATDHSTIKGLGWGAVGGVILGVIFPPSVIGSAAVLGTAGAIVGKLRQLHHKEELATLLNDAIDPGHSGLIALVSDPGAEKIARALDKANRVVASAVNDVVAQDLKAAAREADTTSR